MMQATTSLSLMPLMMCLPGRFRLLTQSPYLTHSEFPLTPEITCASSMAAPRCLGADVLARYAKRTGPRT
jgi:hypothetical protein